MSTERAVSIALSALVTGLAVLAIGLWMSGATFDSSDRIVCDGEVMGPGDACISATASNSGSYEELVQERREGAASSRRNGPTVALLGGLAAAGGAALLLGQSWRSRR